MQPIPGGIIGGTIAAFLGEFVFVLPNAITTAASLAVAAVAALGIAWRQSHPGRHS